MYGTNVIAIATTRSQWHNKSNAIFVICYGCKGTVLKPKRYYDMHSKLKIILYILPSLCNTQYKVTLFIFFENSFKYLTWTNHEYILYYSASS